MLKPILKSWQKGIDAISNGLFHKVVLSRKEIVDVPDFDLVTVLQN
jgi:isochorismate synthase